MGRIYEGCRECLVYLGHSLDGTFGTPTEPTSVLDFGAVDIHAQILKNTRSFRDSGLHEVFEFFHKLSNSNHFLDILPLEEREMEPGNHNNQKALTIFSEALRMFMHAPFTPWWTRIWAVQEVALPPHVILLYGGIAAISFHSMTDEIYRDPLSGSLIRFLESSGSIYRLWIDRLEMTLRP